jgi:hypothetical protein
MKLHFSRQIFEKYSNIKFYEDLSSGSRVVPCGPTDMTKLTVAFPDFVNAPKMCLIIIKRDGFALILFGLHVHTKDYFYRREETSVWQLVLRAENFHWMDVWNANDRNDC